MNHRKKQYFLIKEAKKMLVVQLSNADTQFGSINYSCANLREVENIDPYSDIEYQTGCLTGCLVFDKNSEGTNIPQYRTIVPDAYRENNPDHPICHDFDFVFESTVVNNPDRFDLFYRSAELNGHLDGEIIQGVDLEIGDLLSGYHVEFKGHLLQFNTFSPMVQYDVHHFRFDARNKYRMVANESNNYMVDLELV